MIDFYYSNKIFFHQILFVNNSKDLIISSFFNLIVLGEIITPILILFSIKALQYRLLKILLNLFLSTAGPRRLLTRNPTPDSSFWSVSRNLYVICDVLRTTDDLKTELKYCDEIEYFNYAERTFRPRFRRLARTAFPDFDEFLFLNPCLFFLFLFDILICTFIFT